MMQTIEAEIDTHGRVHLLEKIKIKKKSRALVTILDDEDSDLTEISVAGSMEILDENLEKGSGKVSDAFSRSIKKSAEDLSE